MIDNVIKQKENCTGCYACSAVCPAGCIAMDMDSEGFWYPNVDEEKCVQCCKCINICPVMSKKIIENKPQALACINKDENIRLLSSSGGIFNAIAESVIDKGGVVFGAAFNDKLELRHSYCETMDDITIYRGSKYLQSQIGESYRIAKNFLETGRLVLFTGTPCQIGGIDSYLGKKYENLLTADIICHGVPSPRVWKLYVEYREKKAGAFVRQVFFRSKLSGWKKYSVQFEFIDGTKYICTHDKDLFMRAFLSDICLRPSCYACKFKGVHRISDVTLADFWGVNHVVPDIDDNKGISLVLVNSDKGMSIMNDITENLIVNKVEIGNAIKYNASAIRSSAKNRNRSLFLQKIDVTNFEYLVEKYCKFNFLKAIKRRISRLKRLRG